MSLPPFPASHHHQPAGSARQPGPVPTARPSPHPAAAAAGETLLPGRSMLDRESSLRRLAIAQRHRLPEAVDWQGLRLHERRLVRTHGGIAYLNAAEYSAGTGGLHVPLAPQLPILCSDASLRETWLAQAETALSMQPVPSTVEAAGARLRQALLEAGGDHHRTQQACRRACDAVEQRLDESDRDCRDRRMALLADTARETSRAMASTAGEAMRAAVQRFIDRSMPPL